MAGGESRAGKKRAMPPAVIFDLYETLITEYVTGGHPQPSIAQRLGLAEAEFTAAWRARHDDRMSGRQADYVVVLRAICRELAHPVDDDLLQQLYRERLAIKAGPFGHPDRKILDMLQYLRELHVRLGVISNCTPEEVTAWHTCPLAPYMDEVVFSYEVGWAKPAPQIYQRACQRLRVIPQRALFIGDGGGDELAGAARVGLAPYWATWFLDQWPVWKRTGWPEPDRARYPRLSHPTEVIAVVTRQASQDTGMRP